MPIPSIFWLAATVIFFITEAATVGLTSIWFAAGALGALLTSLFTQNIWIQVVVFLAVTVVCLLAVRPLARRYFTPRRVATNADRVVGAEGVVTQTIDNLKAQGQITVDGAVWTARSQDPQVIPKDTPVRVLRIEGVKVIVAPAEQSPRPEPAGKKEES